MKVLMLLLALFTSNVFAIEAQPTFDNALNKSLKISCDNGESLCDDLCQDAECSFQEVPAQNSLGVSLKVSHFFQNMSRFYKTGDKVSDIGRFKQLLKSYTYVSIDSKSFLNQDYRYNSRSLRKSFQEFCPESERPDYPVVLFSQDVFREIGKVRFVICEKNVYQMKFFEAGEWQVSDF
jgi:hypothetical protein